MNKLLALLGMLKSLLPKPWALAIMAGGMAGYYLLSAYVAMHPTTSNEALLTEYKTVYTDVLGSGTTSVSGTASK